MKALYNTTFVILLSLTCLVQGYNELTIRDPQGWRWETGTIDQAAVAVRPAGAFMEIGLYLTLSAKNTNFSSENQLEVVLDFDLPQGSMVRDSWLWIGDQIIQAKILDKWTAEAIYEDIVDRRRDPSILFKRSATHYQLKIYPLLKGQARKIKLTYLVPAQMAKTRASIPLPTELLATSRTPIQKLHILTWPNTIWTGPGLLEFPELNFQTRSDPEFGEYEYVDLDFETVEAGLHFKVTSPLAESGVHLTTFSANDESYYQLITQPSRLLQEKPARKALFLFDHVAGHSDFDWNALLRSLEQQLQRDFTVADSFNIMISGHPLNKISDTWIPADSSSIEEIFNQLGDNPFTGYSTLASLLFEGIDFITTQNNSGTMVLFSNSSSVGDYQAANSLLEDLTNAMQQPIPVHVFDAQSHNVPARRFGGRTYIGDEYFYLNLSRMTQGEYLNIRESTLSFAQQVQTLFGYLGTFAQFYEQITRVSGGVSYSRLAMNPESQGLYLDQPRIEIGKYSGTIPFQLEITAKINDRIIQKNLQIESAPSMNMDSLIVKFWTGQKIAALERQAQNNRTISEILRFSLSERLLSVYTAFLCLEPEQGGEICYNCMDETELISEVEQTNDTRIDSLQMEAFPNPFNEQTTIRITLGGETDMTDLGIILYNIQGQVVRKFDVPDSPATKRFDIVWDGQDQYGRQVSSGHYFMVLCTHTEQKTCKLVLIR